MTYIEEAVADFTKSVLTDGIKTLLTKKYLPYTLSAMVLIFLNSVVTLAGDYFNLQLSENQISLLLSIEISLGIAFVITGLFIARANLSVQLLFLLSAAVGLSAIFYYKLLSYSIAGILAATFYLGWIAVATISQFSFFRDLLGHPTIGGILFLGKPQDDGKVLFNGTVALITLLNIIMGGAIVKAGLDTGTLSYIIIGAITILLGLINFTPLLHLQSKGDVFFTTITWFYSLTTLRVAYFTFQLLLAKPNTSSSLLDTFFALFFVLFAVHKAAQRGIRMGESVQKEDLITVKPDEVDDDDEYSLGFYRLLAKAISDRGIVLIILGLVIGYHTTTIQIELQYANILTSSVLSTNIPNNIIGQEMFIFTSLIIYLFILILYVLNANFRRYSTPKILRISWLPPYDDLKLVLIGIKNGDINMKGDLLKLTVSMATDKMKSKFLRKPSSSEDKVKSTLDHWIDKAKGNKK